MCRAAVHAWGPEHPRRSPPSRKLNREQARETDNHITSFALRSFFVALREKQRAERWHDHEQNERTNEQPTDDHRCQWTLHLAPDPRRDRRWQQANTC